MNNRMLQLDGLRGVAILLVFFYHAYYRWSDRIDFIDSNLFSYFSIGYLGVNLFFMISGYVIFLSLDNSLNSKDFMFKRWLRLFPCMLVCSILIFFTGDFFYERPNGIPIVSDLIPGFLFLSPELINFIFGLEFKSLEGAFWSLYVEFIFYIICAFIYFVFGRNFILPVIFMISVFSFCLFVLLKLMSVDNDLFSVFNSLGFKFYSWFFIGCAFYIKSSRKLSKTENLMLFVCFAIALIHSKGDVYTLISIIFVILLFVSAFNSCLMIDLLSSRLLVLIGFVSYPFYLVHENFLVSMLIKLEGYHNVPMPFLALSPFFILAFLVSVSYLIAKYIEPQLRKQLSKFMRRYVV